MDIEDIRIEVIKSKRRTMGLEIQRDGKVIVRVPVRTTKKEIESFIDEHRTWICNKLKLVRKRNLDAIPIGAPSPDKITPKELDNIKNAFAERVRYYCEIMNVTVGRITIRNQKTRWGSCSSKGNVNFNYKLYYMPQELMDYVIIHELSHRRYMNHSSEFWNEVEKYCPDYMKCREQLKRYR